MLIIIFDNLCDLIVILSSTYYVKDPRKKSGKKYVNDIVKRANIMQKQGFLVGLTKYKLNEEIQKLNDEEDALKAGWWTKCFEGK